MVKYDAYDEHFAPKEKDGGKWLMSVYETDINHFGNYAHFYKSETGEVTIYLKKGTKYSTVHGNPRFKNTYNKFDGKRYVWLSTFRNSFDENGAYVTVSLIKLNDELTAKALQSETMKKLYQTVDISNEGFTNGTRGYVSAARKRGCELVNNGFYIDYINGNPDVGAICTWLSNQFDKPLDTKASNTKKYIVMPILAALLVTFLISCVAMFNGGSNHVDSATCKVCGRTYEAGDSGGNYKSIAKTGMCKNCYNNYEWGQKATGK